MSKRIATAVAIIGAAGVISGCAFEQPSPGCQVQDSDHPWQAVYTLKNPADASKACGNLKGEMIGIWKYVKDPLTNPSNQVVIRPAGTASRFEYSYEYVDAASGKTKTETVARVDLEALEAEREGQALEVMQAASSGPSSLAMEPDANGLCEAKSFERGATVSAAEVINHVTGEQEVPAETVTYTYNKVEVFSAASAPGTQLRGEFTYSSVLPDGTTCTAEYKMRALWPQVECVPGSTKPAENCGEGSGLNPDFNAVCVAGIGPDGVGGCVPADDSLALKSSKP
jgi:hypothetical protein